MTTKSSNVFKGYPRWKFMKVLRKEINERANTRLHQFSLHNELMVVKERTIIIKTKQINSY